MKLTNLTPAQQAAAEHGLLVIPANLPDGAIVWGTTIFTGDILLGKRVPDSEFGYAIAESGKKVVCPYQLGDPFPGGGVVGSVDAVKLNDDEAITRIMDIIGVEPATHLLLEFPLGSWLWIIRREDVT